MDSFDVIVIGAGVVGPTIATALARQGRSVLIIERDWSRPDRIVGELMQPAGVKALKELGMVKALNNIEAIDCTGYYIKYFNDSISIGYPEKKTSQISNPIKPVSGCIEKDNDKLDSDSTINIETWDNDDRVRGISFHHGDFIQNLRSICKHENNVTHLEGTVTKILRDEHNSNVIIGVEVKDKLGNLQNHFAKLTISCDGIYSKFRKELGNHTPHIGSYFVGISLFDAKLPAKNKGHVILGDQAPVLIYQISPDETRMLCAYASTKPPSSTNNELMRYLQGEVLPVIPIETLPSFKKALEVGKFKIMPNQYLPAIKQSSNKNNGLIVLGDALNMRHPLTGGGMTVGLNDSVLLAKLLHPNYIKDLQDYKLLNQRLAIFHRKRKNLDSVINTLSIALYSLFAADRNSLKILQRGCFRYFELGGECVNGPIGLLSGMLPFPMLLFNHFFSVAFYAVYLNFIFRGLLGFPIAIYEAFDTIITAIIIFTPYLWNELVK
ncbi:unnamed protein product [Candida verbasci]|uniref:Squalene monooxygenase n=1 Tax=Candida verbasci TaxID=1227364 RepID=A0A9W4TUJ4_9ASCO|nr:unnamed protein product [Candida verbasci]